MKKILFTLTLSAAGAWLLAAWQSVGPDGGPGKAVCVSPSNDMLVFVATETSPVRIWRSTNGGTVWEKRGIPYSIGMYFYCMTIDQANNLYAGIWGAVLRSTDQGMTWTNAAVSGGVYAIDFHPTNPSIIFAAGTAVSGGNYEMAFFKSTNGGASFTPTVVLAGADNIGQSIAVDRADPDVIYLGGRDNISGFHPRLFKTTDGGLNWNELTVGTGAGAYMHSVAVHPANSNIVYAGKYTDGIWRSTNAGSTWTKVSTMNSNYSMATSAADPSLIFTSGTDTIARSTDAGLTWTRFAAGTGLGPGCYYDLVVSQANTSRVYTGSQYCVFYRSTDTGASWNMAVAGLRGCNILALGVAPSAPRTMYSEFPRVGIFKTTDAGTSWQLYSTFPSQCGAMCGFVVNRTDPNTVYTLEGDA